MAVLWFFSLQSLTHVPILSCSSWDWGESPILHMNSYPHVSHLTKMLEGWVFIMGISES